jgi:hypothetical protein
MLATAVHKHQECAPLLSSLGGTLSGTSSSMSSRDVRGADVAHLEERTVVARDCSGRRAKAENE